MNEIEQEWLETQTDWNNFLSDIRNNRAAVGATYAGAWFRGQTHSWDLTPSLFRELPKVKNRIESLNKDLIIFADNSGPNTKVILYNITSKLNSTIYENNNIVIPKSCLVDEDKIRFSYFFFKSAQF